MLEVGDFAAVNHTLEEYGFIEGMPIYIAGQGFVPIESSDGYDYRKVFVIIKTKDGHIDLEGGGFTADPKNLIELTDHVKEALVAAYQEDFKEDGKLIASNKE
jgi:hypothetical protein